LVRYAKMICGHDAEERWGKPIPVAEPREEVNS
jgi:hypothetical protein